MSLLRTLLILFIIYYLVRLFTRYILPALFYNYMDNKVNEFARQQKRRQGEAKREARKREGEVTIDYNPRNDLKNGRSRGEYTDYEEIK